MTHSLRASRLALFCGLSDSLDLEGKRLPIARPCNEVGNMAAASPRPHVPDPNAQMIVFRVGDHLISALEDSRCVTLPRGVTDEAWSKPRCDASSCLVSVSWRATWTDRSQSFRSGRQSSTASRHSEPRKRSAWDESAQGKGKLDLTPICATEPLLVVDLQTDLIGIEASRIVAPLREAGRYVAFPGLTPRVEVDGQSWIVRVQELAAVPAAELRNPVGSLAGQRDALKRALDILIDGV